LICKPVSKKWCTFVSALTGELRYLWRAVDHEGEVLESFVTKRRNRKAAMKVIGDADR